MDVVYARTNLMKDIMIWMVTVSSPSMRGLKEIDKDKTCSKVVQQIFIRVYMLLPKLPIMHSISDEAS